MSPVLTSAAPSDGRKDDVHRHRRFAAQREGEAVPLDVLGPAQLPGKSGNGNRALRHERVVLGADGHGPTLRAGLEDGVKNGRAIIRSCGDCPTTTCTRSDAATPAAPRATSSAGRSNAGSGRSPSPTTSRSTSCRRPRGTRSSPCARATSTATSGRSTVFGRSSGAGSPSGSASRPTTPRATRRSSPAGSGAPTGTSSSARSTGSTAAGSTTRPPLPAASRGKGPSTSTTATTGCSRRPPPPGSSTCSRTSTCRRSTGTGRRRRARRPRTRPSPRPQAAACAVEISSAGLRKPVGEAYPEPRLLSAIVDAGIPVTFSSDAHAPAEVGLGLREDAGARPGGGRDRVRHVREEAADPAPPPAVNHRPSAAKTSAEGRRRRANVA